MNSFNLKILQVIIFSGFLISVIHASGQTANPQNPLVSKEADKPSAILGDAAPTDLLLKAEDSTSFPPVPVGLIEKDEKKAVNALPVAPDTLRHLSLADAVDLLLQNNLNLLTSRYNLNAVQVQRIIAGLRPLAAITVSATQFNIPQSFLHPQNFITGGSGNSAANISYTVEYDRLVERGGKRNLRISQAELNIKAAEFLATDTLRQQTLQLKQSFLGALLARENLRVALDNYTAFKTSKAILNTQVKEGYAAGVDLKRIELQELQYQRDISSAEQNFQQSTRDIYNFIGFGDAVSVIDDAKSVNYDDASFIPQIKADLEILTGNLDINPVLLSISELRQNALDNRPDVKNAEYNLDAAKVGLKLAESQQVRDITVGGQFSRVGGDNTFGVVATIPLGIKQRADLAEGQAQIIIKTAGAQLRLVQTQALTDVEKAYTAYMTSRSRLHLFNDKALVEAFDVRKIEEISYRDGAKGLLDYLDAQRIYNQTLLDYNQTRYDYLLSLTQLEAATGKAITGN